MGPHVAFVSFRFGRTDGVSVVTRTWIDAFRAFGFDVRTVSDGSTPWPDVDHDCIPGLGFVAEGTDDRDDPGTHLDEPLRTALADVDLVVVENLLTIPMRLAASRSLGRVLAGRRAIVHHHDPPWSRERFAGITELPATDPAWRHVAINRGLVAELAGLGIDAELVHNGFAAPASRTSEEQLALRAGVRAALGVAADAALIAHPVRAIERKNVPAAIRLAEAVGATYWLLGPAEEDYAERLAAVLAAARCPVVHHPWDDTDGIYAAADHVAFPSTWEGFGNPPIEAALRRRTVSVGSYPVADELAEIGFEWFAADDDVRVRLVLEHPDHPTIRSLIDINERVATEHFSIPVMRARLHDVLDAAGWAP